MAKYRTNVRLHQKKSIKQCWIYKLTGKPNYFKEPLEKIGIHENNSISIKSVSPLELESYYKESHYGFILRDDILVNRVACPTKLIEYLGYGINPIILSEKIGDFEDFGYEHIRLDQFNTALKAKKSTKNIDIFNQIKTQNNYNIRDKIIELKKKLY